MNLVKKIFNISIFLYLLIFTFHCNKQEIHIINGRTMGTTYSISIYDYQVDLDSLQNKVDLLLNDINLQMSTYIENSEISKINKSKSGSYEVSENLLKVADKALAYYSPSLEEDEKNEDNG